MPKMSTSDVSPSERILQDRLDSGLAQIKSSSKKKKKTKDKKRKRESREPELEEDLYKERKRQRKEKTSIILPEGISGESELDEDNAVTEQDEWETMKKSKKAKDEDTSSEFSVDIDNVPRDITTQSHSKKSKKHNVDTEQQKASKSTKNAQEHPKPAKETRIVPVKVGGLWKLPVLESAQRKPEEIVQTAGAVSTPDTSFAIDSEEDPFDEERENIVASKKHNISTPVFPSGQDGAAPAPSKTKKSSKHSSSTTCSSASTKGKLENGQAILSQAVAAIKTSLPSILESISLPDSITPTHKPARAPKATPKPSGASKSEGESERKNRAKDTPNSWQEYPGKLRGKVESSGDAEVEESNAPLPTFQIKNTQLTTVSRYCLLLYLPRHALLSHSARFHLPHSVSRRGRAFLHRRGSRHSARLWH